MDTHGHNLVRVYQQERGRHRAERPRHPSQGELHPRNQRDLERAGAHAEGVRRYRKVWRGVVWGWIPFMMRILVYVLV